MAVKKNQGNLYAEVENFFIQAVEVEAREASCDYFIQEEKSRNHQEKREVWVTSKIDWLPMKSEWKDLTSIAMVKSSREEKGKKSTEFRYYITNLNQDAEYIGKSIRGHWSVENKLHWQLDVSYREDECKIRKDHGAENFSVLRRATLNLLKAGKKTKVGIKNKRSKAGGLLNELCNCKKKGMKKIPFQKKKNNPSRQNKMTILKEEQLQWLI